MSRKFEFVKRYMETKNFGAEGSITRLPERSTKKSAGYDFYNPEDIVIPPYKIGDNPTLVPTGIKAKMNDNEWLMLVNRSSNPKKKKLVIPNSLGVIDADYYNNPDNEGEIMFAFYNVSNEPVELKVGDKLGQGIFMKYYTVDNDNSDGERLGGFGSTDNVVIGCDVSNSNLTQVNNKNFEDIDMDKITEQIVKSISSSTMQIGAL